MDEVIWSKIGRLDEPRRAQQQRRAFLEKEKGLSGSYFEVDPSRTGKIENTIGCMQLPLGVVGPIKIEGEFAGEYMVPMVTTESCLVASCQRGAKIFSVAEGINVNVEKVGMTRACVLKCASAAGAGSLQKFIEENEEKIKELAESTSNHLILKGLKFAQDEELLHMMLIADTNAAMGMNMLTIAIKKVVDDFVLKEAPIAVTLIAESGNFCSDKKPSELVAELGRGQIVEAEATVAGWQLMELGVNVEQMLELHRAKLVSGSKLAKSLAVNAHHANMVAAFYMAFGQDLAYVVEGSLGSTIIEKDGQGLKFKIRMPAVLVGTIGGGTKLPQVKELFKLVNLKEGDDPAKLAALLGALVLCGETSLLLALAAKDLAAVHAKMR